MGRRTRGRMTVIASAAVAALIAGGGTYALAGQGASTLSACVHRKGGGLYQAKKCAHHDKKLSWSIVGPTGPQGATGPAGSAGLAGKSGNNGTSGTNGTNGIGATTSPVALTATGGGQDLASLGSTASVYGNCATSAGVHVLLGIDSTASWQVSGSYSTYQLQANGTAIVANGSATSAIGTYAIADSSSGAQSVVYTVIPTTSPGLMSGVMHVTVGGSGYEVDYNIYSEPGATDLCQGEVTVYPTS